MKTHLMAFGLGVMVTLLVMGLTRRPVTLAPAVQAQEIPVRGQASCAPGFLWGAYNLTLQGVTVRTEDDEPYAALGILTLDEAGNASLTVTQTYDGSMRPTITTAGRYTMSTNCGGTLVLNTGARFEIVANSTGREISLLQNVQGAVVQGTAKRQ